MPLFSGHGRAGAAMQLTAGEIVTIIAAVGLVVTQVITALKTVAKVAEVQSEQRAVAQVADTKLNTIHDLTNSNLTSVKTDLALANDRIEKLQVLIAKIATDKQGENVDPAVVVSAPETPEQAEEPPKAEEPAPMEKRES